MKLIPQFEDYLPDKNKEHFLNRPKIGIIGGMGPKSTAPFLDKVVHYFQNILGFLNDEDFPYIEIISLPTPFRVDHKVDKKITLYDIKYAIEQLNNRNINLIAIPCNTVHAYYDEYNNYTKIPILNIVDETVKKIKETSKSHISVLATEATMNSNIYQNKLRAEGFEIISYDNLQSEFNAFLKLIKSGQKNELLSREYKKIEAKLNSLGTQIIVSACTDISFILENEASEFGFIYIDSMDILAKYLVLKYKELLEISKDY